MFTHRNRIHRWAAVGAIVLIPVASACGGDDDDRLSEADFLEQGNQVCAESNTRIEAAAAETFGSDGTPELEALTAFLDELKTEVRGQIDGIDALKPPEDLEDEVDELVATANDEYDQMVADIDADPMAFAEADNDPFAEANAMNAAIGLTECSG